MPFRSAGDEQPLIEALRFVLGALRGAGRTGEMEAMTDHALHISDGSDTSRALLLAQFGAAAKDARMPSAFLENVGDQAQTREERIKRKRGVVGGRVELGGGGAKEWTSWRATGVTTEGGNDTDDANGVGRRRLR